METDATTAELERLLLDQRDRFLRFVLRRTDSRARAEEVLQDAYLKLAERGAPTDDAESVVAWFYRVLRNALIDQQRRNATEAKATAALDAPEPEDAELRDAVCACVLGVLPAVKHEYAELIRQVDLEETPVSEVARREGITPNNAMVRLHRARQAVRKQLERSCGACATHGCLECGCGGMKLRR